MLNIAVVGTGAICPSHLQGYLTFPDQCEIVALCDIYPEKAEKVKKEFSLSSTVYSNMTDLLAQEEVDLISVCTPPYTHASLAVEALDAGKHVLVEKPMASSLEECDAMNEAAKRNDKILSIVAQNRFTTPMMRMKHLLEKDLIGDVLHTQVDSFWWRGHSYYDLWWRGTWEKEGGGCTLNHAVHHIDIFQWMRGLPDEITAVTSNTAHDNAEVEDISIAIGRYKSGSLAQITSSVVHHGEEQQLIFQGEKARVSVPWQVKASLAQENGFPKENQPLEETLTEAYENDPALTYEGHAGQIQNVLEAIQHNGQVLVDGVQGRQTLELITAIYESANYQRTVKLPLTEASPFYTSEGILENVKHFYEKGKSIENFEDNEITT
ncbi:Gfo/Idh/MocA family protein [Gracilibacillus timonensis]|uniref:Gfo/Idh/MocA family protein n=1 Tax=Gracilibacillus timonensis TaxID=1816696 RepID=UPI0008269F75|nr:Gfo/Idh/MocA family oxidoreductase [Gracilibacillus timonensis]